MKDMVYDHSQKRILDEGTVQGFNYLIISRGTHPCAYVEVPKGHPFYRKKMEDIDVCCHGGVTYTTFHLKNFFVPLRSDYSVVRPGYWIGWDYNHFGDYAAYPNCTMSGRRYTTEEIKEEVALVVKQLIMTGDINGKYQTWEALERKAVKERPGTGIEQRPLRDIAAELQSWMREHMKSEINMHFLKCELLDALSNQESVKTAEETAGLTQLEELARPLVEYLRKNHHPHTAIVVTSERVTLSEDLMSVPFELED